MSSHRSVSQRLRGNAKRLRREFTEVERAMWRLLRDRRLAGFKFRRQVPFRNFILDFVCYENHVVIEIDGGQHADSLKDRVRDEALSREGFRVLRYWNNDVLTNSEGVLLDLLHHLT